MKRVNLFVFLCLNKWFILNINMEIFSTLLHLDNYLNVIIQTFGLWTYVIVFIIIFCETGLVFAPFLPGDSLLFAVGAFAAVGKLHVGWLFFILGLAAILGDTVNYWIGNFFGEYLLKKTKHRLIKEEHIQKTQKFFEKYGAKTIVIARFVPIVRTIAPFIAGVGKMSYLNFLFYNIIGGLFWVFLFVFGGYFFGNLPIVKNNFSLVILVIIVLSILPGLIEYYRHAILAKKK